MESIQSLPPADWPEIHAKPTHKPRDAPPLSHNPANQLSWRQATYSLVPSLVNCDPFVPSLAQPTPKTLPDPTTYIAIFRSFSSSLTHACSHRHCGHSTIRTTLSSRRQVQIVREFTYLSSSSAGQRPKPRIGSLHSFTTTIN